MQLDLRTRVLPSKVPGREFCQPNMGGAYFGRYRGVAVLSMNADDAHRRAGALFKKEQQLREGQQAMAEYEAELQATREKTARLRALRLARDAANNKKTRPAKQ